MGQYIVKRGDTIYSIANRFGLSFLQLMSINPQIRNPALIFIGQVINIPVSARQVPIIYTIRPGETLYALAQRFEISLNLLLAANPQIVNPSILTPGLHIIIPVATPFPGVTIYFVRTGDTLSSIARIFSTTVTNLLKLQKFSFKILQPHKNQTLRRHSKSVANSVQN